MHVREARYQEREIRSHVRKQQFHDTKAEEHHQKKVEVCRGNKIVANNNYYLVNREMLKREMRELDDGNAHLKVFDPG